MSKTALITGITGQDGSYLAELLLSKGYQVHGVIRRASTFNTSRIDHVFEQLSLHHGDVTDAGAMARIVSETHPDEVYNLAAQSHVKVSFNAPAYTADATAIGALNMLEAVRVHQARTGKQIRFYQASSSEMYGKVQEVPQRETTPFYPRSPYGCAKAFAHHLTVNYREAYGLHASCGISFNHEAPRRLETFVTRKITRAATRIKMGLQSHVELGNMDAKRDWGYAGDYVEAMWLMLQQDTPDDYVIATGVQSDVVEFCSKAFALLGMDWRAYVKINPKYNRPCEVDTLLGDASKARRVLGWQPRTSLDSLIQMMIESDMELARRERG